MSSPTTRSIANLAGRGYTVAVVERWNSHARIRHDVWGFADLLVCHPILGIALAQVCGGGGGDLAARRHKIASEPRATIWLVAGGKILIQQWIRRKPLKGKKRVRIELREEWISA